MIIILCVFIILIIFKVFVKLTAGLCKSSACLVGKTALITGGSAGLGYETALALASRGCRVIITSRKSADNIKEDIIRRTNNPNIKAKSLDLSSFESVKKFAAEINASEERLDILINNAGIGTSAGNTKDGINGIMQVNHFGPFLLTHLLLDLLKKSAPSRIIFVSSILAYCHNFNDIEELKNPLKSPEKQPSVLKGITIYGNSKLCNIIASQEFAERLKPFGVTSNSLHPGVVATDIFKKTLNSKIGIGLLYLVPGFFFKNVFEGIQTTIHLAVSNKLKDITGKYFVDCKQFRKPTRAYDEEFCKRVWEFSEKVVNLEGVEKVAT